MKETKISWAHATLNFWVGCNHVSAECEGCYAETLVKRMGNGRTFNVLNRTAPATWREAYKIDADAKRRNGTAIVFTCSMSDFFHVQADPWRREAWQVIRDCTSIRWLILTKRPERIANHLPADWGEAGYPNVWLGVTVGVRKSYARLDLLRKIPCALRFISAEPLLESLHDIELDGIGWVAAGGMSGSLYKSRAMKIHWAYDLYRRCRKAGIPFLFKQSSQFHSERGIDGLNRYIALTEGGASSENKPLIREYPETDPPLLPFAERGQRFSEAGWLVQIESTKSSPPTVAVAP